MCSCEHIDYVSLSLSLFCLVKKRGLVIDLFLPNRKQSFDLLSSVCNPKLSRHTFVLDLIFRNRELVFVIMRPFMSGSRALFSLISCRNAIRSRGGIGPRSFISNRIGSLSGVERCSSHGWSREHLSTPGTGRVIQRRHFLGCGDGEEGGGGGELSKIYEERRVLG